MPYNPYSKRIIISSILIASSNSWAADAPDAGRLLREQPTQTPQVFSPPTILVDKKASDQQTPPTGPTLTLSDFVFEGVTLVSADELKLNLSQFVGKPLSFDDIQRISVAITAFYSAKGYVARAVVPPQEIENGVLRILVIEGTLGEIGINNQGTRARSEAIEGFLKERLHPGETMNLSKLGEALNIINDQPGIAAGSSLKAGAKEGEVNVLVTAEDKALTEFNASLSNEGSRATGEARAVYGASLMNPTGRFDAANLILTQTQGSRFVSTNYSFAAGYSGLRLGANASYLDYDVVQNSLKSAESEGYAITYGVFGSYPIYRLKNFSLAVSASLGQKALNDFTIAGEVGDRKVTTASFGINGERLDSYLGGGRTTFGLTAVVGDSDQRNEGARLQDSLSREAFGHFSKLNYSLGRQQQLTPTWVLGVSLRGQFAFDNLDSSERFSLGGVSGVRAYPSGEAGGDQGHLLSIDLNHQFTPSLFGKVFLDTGWIRDNHSTWDGWNAGNPGQKNSYTLSGVGTGLDWGISENVSLSALIAKPIGNNPGEDANGNDSDGRDQGLRGWVSLVARF
jgi:hemolysin activation/secretion protein